jgi:tRNA G10  N-methylase Trm11
VVEREGALRPVIAAAMVHLAGPARGTLIDPCCGGGTILAEAASAGWRCAGGDLDSGAIAATVANTQAPVALLDARRLPFQDDAADVVVTNLPFGRQYPIPGSPVAWYRRVLQEAMRVAPTAVVLAPRTTAFRQALGRLPIELNDRIDITVLGRPATIWPIRRPRR